jgi:cell division protein FtsX
MMGMMSVLVTLTVRAGLRAQRSTLELLQHIGATQALVQQLVSRQVMERAVLGWALASAGAVAVMMVAVVLWPSVGAYVGWGVWLGLAVAPALLPAVAWVTSRVVVARLTQGLHTLHMRDEA